MHLFRKCKKFRPRSLKIRSPDHVEWPRLRKSLNAGHSNTEWPITLKLSKIDIRNSIYEIYIPVFLYRWPKVISILRPLQYKLMEWNWKAPLLDENHSKLSQTSGYRYKTWHSDSENCDQWTLLMSPKSFQFMNGHQQFFRETSEQLKHHRRVPGRLYGSTSMQHDLFRSGHDFDLGSNCQHDLLKSNYSLFDASCQEKKKRCLQSKCRANLLNQNNNWHTFFFFVKMVIFRDFALWRLNRWSLVKFEGTSAKEC